MRDWNYVCANCWATTPLSFDLTYEGLKLCRPNITNSPFACFDLTYEGLKLCRPNITNSPFACFDLTYEGLKQFCFRNNCALIDEFWSYLWGIETPFLILLYHYLCNVLILPMRDWNFSFQYLKNWSSFGFDLTYEGLKLGITAANSAQKACFDLTYEGLKWKNCQRYFDSAVMFWSYLWGIEMWKWMI